MGTLIQSWLVGSKFRTINFYIQKGLILFVIIYLKFPINMYKLLIFLFISKMKTFEIGCRQYATNYDRQQQLIKQSAAWQQLNSYRKNAAASPNFYDIYPLPWPKLHFQIVLLKFSKKCIHETLGSHKITFSVFLFLNYLGLIDSYHNKTI